MPLGMADCFFHLKDPSNRSFRTIGIILFALGDHSPILEDADIHLATRGNIIENYRAEGYCCGCMQMQIKTRLEGIARWTIQPQHLHCNEWNLIHKFSLWHCNSIIRLHLNQGHRFSWRNAIVQNIARSPISYLSFALTSLPLADIFTFFRLTRGGFGAFWGSSGDFFGNFTETTFSGP